MKKEIPLDKIVEFKLTSNNSPLSPDTVDEIMKTSYEFFRNEKGVFEMFPFDKFDKEIEWRWQTERGSLPKRIESWFYHTYKMKLDSGIASNIGNIARVVMPKDQIYYFDFTKDFYWGAGEFGDPQSCFFSSEGPLRAPMAMMESGRFRAIRFFKKLPKHTSLSMDVNKYYETDDSYYIGISRSWMGDSPKTNSSLKVIFNGYGLTTVQISSIIANYLDATVKKVQISATELYTNGDGYVIGDKEEVTKFGERFNLNFDY